MAKTSPNPTLNPGIILVVSFFVVAVVNAVIIYLANAFFPGQVVLGTFSLTNTWALILSSSVISLATIFVLPFINQAETNIGRPWSPPEMMGMYLIINFVAVWGVTRFAEIFGLGVTSWFVVLVLAVILDFLQGMVMMGVEKMLKR